MNSTHGRRFAALTLGAGLALTGCSKAPEATFESSATQQSAAASGSSAASAGEQSPQDDAAADSAAAAGIDLTTLGEPIATAEIPASVEGDPKATMKVVLHSLTREGETLVGTYSFTLESTADPEKDAWLYDYLGDHSWSPHLIDPVNLARHDVLEADLKWAKTDSQGSKFGPGDTFYTYAAFAAPPAGVTSMTAILVEGAPPAEVTIQ
ncbi:MAG: hypothetical protein V9G19_08525 [Tetrasphaera sp.]